jgi:hypothetical protein
MENQNNELNTKEKTNNKGIIIALSLVIVMLAVVCVLFATNIISFNKQETPNNDIVENNKCPEIDKCPTPDEYECDSAQVTKTVVVISKADMNIIDKLNGYWINKEEHLFISVDKELSFTSAVYASDGGDYGAITNTKTLGNNLYELEVFVGGCKGSGCLKEEDDKTLSFKIELNEDAKTIKYNNVTYEYIGEEWNQDLFEE